MANKRVCDLANANSVSDSDMLLVDTGSASKKVTKKVLLSNCSPKEHSHSYNDLTDKPTLLQGEKGDTGVSIKSITSTNNTSDGGTSVVTVTLTDGSKSTFNVKNGSKGSTGEKGDKGDKGDAGTTDWDGITNKPTIPTVPTNVSSFTNDAGYLTSIPSEYVTETELNDAISGLGGGTGNVSSDVIRSIMVVDALPEVELEGVLYLVKETTTDTPDEPTVTNLYPNQETSTTSDGFTITFTGRNVTIDGSNDTGSIQCETNQFDIALEANKTYYLQLTNVSGSFDDSNRVSENDGMICRVELDGYDSSSTPNILINQVERDASGIYNKFTFTPSVACKTGRLLIQAKKLTSFSNWTCSIVIAEEGV